MMRAVTIDQTHAVVHPGRDVDGPAAMVPNKRLSAPTKGPNR